MLDHRVPLNQISRARNAAAIGRPGLNFAPVAETGLLLLQGDPLDALFQDAILQQFGLRPPGPQAVSIRDHYTLLWMTPKECLLELPATEALLVQAALVTRLEPALAAVTNASDSFAGFDVSGEHAADILMTGCSLDLRPHAFASGQALRTSLADTPAIIWKPESSQLFRCWVDRSYAAHFWNWIAESPAGW